MFFSNTPKNNFWASPFRVFALFALGIILPAGLLGYLGFKSFRYEDIVIKNQSEQRYAAAGDAMRKSADDFFANLIDAVNVLAGSDAFQRWNVPAIVTQLLGTRDIKGFPVQEFFVFDEQDQMVIPSLVELHENAASAPGGDVNWGPLTDEINRLSKLEFTDKNPSEALKGYLALRTKSLPNQLEAALLKYMASCYRKLNDPSSAESMYLELIKRFDQNPDPAGYPEGIVGRQLLADFYQAEGQSEKSLSSRLDVVEGILLSRWAIPGAQQKILLKQISDVITKKISEAPGLNGDADTRWVYLQSLQSRLESQRKTAQNFLLTAWPSAIRDLRSKSWLDKGGVLLSAAGREGELIVVCPIWNPSTHHRQGLLVALLNGAPVWKSVDALLMTQAQSGNLKFVWGHAPPTPAWQVGLERSLETVSPALLFQLLVPVSDAQREFLRRRMWTYGGMIGLSFIVIIIGLIVMFQSIRREKENADLKAEFVANVSHELRTPLTAISYIGERLRSGRYRSPEEAAEFYGMLEEETGHLRELIEDVLDFSKVMGGKKVYQKEPVSLNTVVAEAHARFQLKAQAQGFTISLKLPDNSSSLLLDDKAIRQAILNLLDNALKYSGASRSIDIQLEETPQEVVVSVRDYGIGIAEAEREKIFEKFYRVGQGAVRDAQGGVGLGLAMVKHIVEAHGGSVAFISEMEKGTTFFLKFPKETQ